ncbi:MAG: cyclodeaminase/cyclohydrolase family protein, partial [Anaerolineae bacterium]|nr:cyclodeaminase/cyclohydrolase family protein [Anaerolineae bacterium]
MNTLTNLDNFIDRLASGDPTPGGGSAAALAGAAGAALVAMVARLTVGRKRYIDAEPQMQEIMQRAETLR